MLHNKASEILSNITIYNKYVRYLKQERRRETWQELVTRNKEMHLKKFPGLSEEIEEVYRLVYEKKILPSMRSLQFSGRAIETSNARMFNCSFLPIDSPQAFAEVMFLLLSGTGVGFSVQQKHIEKLPPIRQPIGVSRKYLIGDSIEGWSDAIKVLIKAYTKPNSHGVRFDFSGIREKGAELVTSGGKAPGPEPLRICLEKIEALLKSLPEGTQLEDYQVHDICCYEADAVLAGGIRRAALISLFNLDSPVMLKAKSNFELLGIEPHYSSHVVDSLGEPRNIQAEFSDPVTKIVHKEYRLAVNEPGYGEQEHLAFLNEDEIIEMAKTSTVPWYHCRPHRGRANNSVVILRPKLKKKNDFLKIWKLIEESGAGEPGLSFTNV